MYQDKKIIAIIPARGGSKGILHKNIVPLAGMPLMAYSIEAAKGSRYCDAVYVSSDSSEILAVARERGAQTLERPAELATDTAQTFRVLQHIITSLAAHGEAYDYWVLLQPTSPLRTSADIDMGVEKLVNSENDMLIAITEAPLPPDLMITVESDQAFFQNENLFKDVRKQNLPQYYNVNGALYVYKTEVLKRATQYPYVKGKTGFHLMERYRSIDIDTLDDLYEAECILKNLKK